MKTHYADKVKTLRTARAWSQEQPAEIAGVNVRTMQRVERGEGASCETLKALANAFDMDVSALLAAPPTEAGTASKAQPTVMFLGRVRTGRELFNIVGGGEVYSYDNYELPDDNVEVVAHFFQDIRDWCDLWNEIEPADRVRVPHDFNARIAELEEHGLGVFAGSQRRPYQFKMGEQAEVVKMNTVFVLIVKKENSAIIQLEGEDAAMAATQR